MKIPALIAKNIDSLIAAIAGFILIQLFTNYSGIGLSWDSILYTSVARNLNSGNGLVDFNRLPLVDFPVLFPSTLGLVMFVTRLDPVVTGASFTGILFAFVIFCCSIVIERFRFKLKLYKWLMLAGLVLSPSLLAVYTRLWSETLFVVWVMLFLLAFNRYQQSHQLKALIIAALIAAISTITRYAGITLIGTGGLLLLFDPSLKLLPKIRHILVFGFVSVSFFVANLVRNAIITGSLTGPRQKGINSFAQNISYYGTVICGWFGFDDKQSSVAFFIGIFSLLGFIALMLWHFFQKSKYFEMENVLITFFVVYALFILFSSTVSRYETINNRLLSPVFIPFLLGTTSWFASVLKRRSRKLRNTILTAASLILLLFIFCEFKLDAQRYNQEKNYGVPGFNNNTWNKSPLGNFLRKNKQIFNPDYQIYSNGNATMYLVTGKQCWTLPNRHYRGELKNFTNSTDPCYVIWFNKITISDLMNLEEIKPYKKLKQLYKFRDGAIYLVTSLNEDQE